MFAGYNGQSCNKINIFLYVIIFQHYVMNCLKNSLPFYLFHFLKIRNFLSRLFFDWYKDLSIFQFSFPSCRLICNRITFGIFSNIIGMRNDPKCSCWIPTIFKALTLLSIRSYSSLNLVTFEPFTLFNSFQCGNY